MFSDVLSLSLFAHSLAPRSPQDCAPPPGRPPPPLSGNPPPPPPPNCGPPMNTTGAPPPRPSGGSGSDPSPGSSSSVSGYTKPVSVSMVDAYASLNFAGVVLLSSLILTIVFARKKRVRRDPCLVNAFVVVVLVNILNTMYYMQNRSKLSNTSVQGPGADGGVWGSVEAGTDGTHTSLCRAQAILQAGSQAAQAAAVLAVVLRLWLKTIRLTVPWFNKFRRWPTLTFLLALPYLCIIVFVPPVAVLTQAKRDPDYIPTPFYCSLVDHKVKQAGRFFALGISAVALALDIWVMIMVHRHFRQTRLAAQKARDAMSASFGIDISFVRPHRSMGRAFFTRVILFIGWTVAMMAATLYQAFDYVINDPISDVAFACIAPIAFFCFASQPDILRAWHIPATKREWRRFLRLDARDSASSTSTTAARPRPRRIRRWKGATAGADGRAAKEAAAAAGGAVAAEETLDLHEFLGNYHSHLSPMTMTEGRSTDFAVLAAEESAVGSTGFGFGFGGDCDGQGADADADGDVEGLDPEAAKDWDEMDLPQFLQDTRDLEDEKEALEAGATNERPRARGRNTDEEVELVVSLDRQGSTV